MVKGGDGVTKLLIGLNFVLTAILVFMILFFNRTAGDYYHAKVEAIHFAEEHASLVQPQDFYWFNSPEAAYFTVTGQNEHNEAIVVIIRQSDGAIMTLKADEIVSKQMMYNQVMNDVNPLKILNYRMGIIESNVPIWEVTYKKENGKIGYYIASLETGSWLRTIDNL